MVISYFLLNKEIYEYTYDIRKIFLVLYEIRKFVKYIRNVNTTPYPSMVVLKSKKIQAFKKSAKSFKIFHYFFLNCYPYYFIVSVKIHNRRN